MVEGQITLREALPEDAPFLAHLYGDTRREEVGAWGWPVEQQKWFLRVQFEARQRSYRSSFPKAVDHMILWELTPVGRMLVSEESAALRLVDIALLSAYRNRGIGGALLDGLRKRCEREGRILHVSVLQGNPAVRLYRRLGFRQTAPDSVYVQMEWSKPVQERCAC